MLTAKQIRQKFLEFYKDKGHAIVPSAPIVLKDDPTLMFTNAGMNQFKDLFLGNAPAKNTRVADAQKCLRVSGKHNDLEEVGYDTYHHTMFEMLGNWSFGDYFKEEAIAWSWELLTEVFKIDKERLYVSVFEGDEGDSLPLDQEAKNHWLKLVPEEKIINGNKKDNFWEMGETGPCGPCSEIHIDLRNDEERAKIDGKHLVNQDHPQVVEVWNLVFMEFNRKADGSLEKLPEKHVDTGMGFERLCMALQGKKSNYDTDVFQPIIAQIEKESGRNYGQDEQTDVAMRVVADHVRAIAFAIADGQLPANTGAGYVIRRILRRAIRYGYSQLMLREPFIYKLVDVLAAEMGEFFPEILQQKQLVQKVIQEEETSFLRTISQGLERIEQLIADTKSKVIDGAQAFELYDTFGFPVDLTALILREFELELDMAGFEAEMKKQKERSRAATKLSTDDWQQVIADKTQEFIGYDQTEANVRIAQYRKVTGKKKSFYQLIFNHTPFYAEGGGQVGDTGIIVSENESIKIFDTKRENGQIVHYAESLPKYIKFQFVAKVDANKRRYTTGNHTATHLLHAALREILGAHVEQKGSLVAPDHLRFDFSHFEKIDAETLLRIEERVNHEIRANAVLEEFRNIPISEAKEMGAMMLFGEKYGDTVRAIKFGNSIELCGGTHVAATGQIGLFKITHESAVAAGIRRIEAITGIKADAYVNGELATLREVKEILKNPKNPVAGLQTLKTENAKLQKEILQLRAEKAKHLKQNLLREITSENELQFLATRVDLDPASAKDLAFQLKAEVENLLLVFVMQNQGKVNVSVALHDNLVSNKNMHAGKIVKELAALVKGGGGGQASFAMAGGKDAAGIDALLNRAKQIAEQA